MSVQTETSFGSKVMGLLFVAVLLVVAYNVVVDDDPNPKGLSVEVTWDGGKSVNINYNLGPKGDNLNTRSGYFLDTIIEYSSGTIVEVRVIPAPEVEDVDCSIYQDGTRVRHKVSYDGESCYVHYIVP